MASPQHFLRMIGHPLKWRLFLLTRLPSAYFSGVRIEYVDENACVVSVPYKWFSKNPFRSTYFACLAMAAEMSTGVMAMMHLYNRKPAISMLVTTMTSNFEKKATGVTRFSCKDGKAILSAIEAAAVTGEAQQYVATATGNNEKGEQVAVFSITWSFKAKS